jgi:hypothetical protein
MWSQARARVWSRLWTRVIFPADTNLPPQSRRAKVFMFRGGRSIGVVRDLAKVQAWVRVPSTAPFLQVPVFLFFMLAYLCGPMEFAPDGGKMCRSPAQTGRLRTRLAREFFLCALCVKSFLKKPQHKGHGGHGEFRATARGFLLPARETRRMPGCRVAGPAPVIPPGRRCARFVRAARAILLRQNAHLRKPA